MIEYEDECVGCPPEMGCMGSSCRNRNVPHYYCDKCGEEFYSEELVNYNGEQLCKNCLFDLFPTIN